MKKIASLGCMVAGLTVLSSSLLAESTNTQVEDPTLYNIQATHKVKIGYRASLSPFSYRLDDGRVLGYSIDLCNEIVKELKKTDPLIQAEYVEVTAANRLDMVKSGKVDMECTSTTNTAKRRNSGVAFSIPYYIANIRALTLAKDHVHDMKDLKDHDAIVITSSTTATTQTLTNVPLIDYYFTSKNILVVKGKDYQDSFRKLTDGEVKMFTADDVLLSSLIANSTDPSIYKLLDQKFTVEPYGIMVSKNSPKLLKIINMKFIDLMYSKTYENSQFEGIYNKWFKNPIPPKNTNLNIAMGSILKEIVRFPTVNAGNVN